MSRICIVRHYYYPEDPRSRREAESLAEAGHHVDILTLRKAGEPAREDVNGVHVRRLPVGHYRGSLFHYAYEYGAFFLLAFLTLSWRSIVRRYDVVQVNSLPDFLVFVGSVAKLMGSRLVLDMHECTPELFCTKYGAPASHPIVRVLGWVEQFSLRFADQVVTCTPQQKAVFASRGTSPDKIEVVLNAANPAIFKPRNEEPVLWERGGSFELVSHGLIALRYGLDTMVHAVALLRDQIPGLRLHVYGKGDYQAELEGLIEELGIGDRVIIHGFVPEEELLDGIANAHVGVIAAKRDSFRDLTQTQKMYEYVAMRKPVVIAETSAVRTHFDDSCFQFFRSDDPADLARALLDLYRHPERAVPMIEESSFRYRSYSWDAQRYVYASALFGTEKARLEEALVPVDEPAVRVPATVPAMELLPVAMDAIPVIPSTPGRYTRMVEPVPAMDLAGLMAPHQEASLYMSEMAIPVEEGGI